MALIITAKKASVTKEPKLPLAGESSEIGEQSESRPLFVESLGLLSLADEIIKVVPESRLEFGDWRQRLEGWLENSALESLQGKQAVEALTVELYNIWLKIVSMPSFSGLDKLGAVDEYFTNKLKTPGCEELQFDKYQIDGVLGEGNFGKVYRVRDRESGQVYAMKLASIQKKKHVYESELKILSLLTGGPHIPALQDSFFDGQGRRAFLIDHLDGGNLKEAIMARGSLKEAEAMAVLGQIVKAVAHAHSFDPPIIHRDIKPSNIVGKKTGNNRMQWFLADWGLAAEWKNTKEPTVSGTYSYTAPEVWKKKRYLVSDVYALGMTLYFMLFGRPAYDGNSDSIRKAQKAPKQVVVPVGCPEYLQKLLNGMLEKNPKKRWSLKQVMEAVLPQGKKPQAKLIMRRALAVGNSWRVDIAGFDMDFKWIPGGKFLMGQQDEERAAIIEEYGEDSYNNSFSREAPQHQIELDGFWFSSKPVTRKNFFRFQKESGYKTTAQREGWHKIWNPESGVLEKVEGGDWRDPGFNQDDDHPVINVSYHDALAMAEWLSNRCHRLIQLPSEAQWEFACRGGSATAFASGSKISGEQANFDGRKRSLFCENGKFYAGTTSVNNFAAAANGYGIEDMHGNVYEWTRDWFEAGYYDNSPAKNPRSLYSSSGERVIRGGSWLSYAVRVRSAYRDRFSPSWLDADIGFRFMAQAYPWEE